MLFMLSSDGTETTGGVVKDVVTEPVATPIPFAPHMGFMETQPTKGKRKNTTRNTYPKVFGKYGVTVVLHLMGENGWDRDAAVWVLERLGVTGVNLATINTGLTDGKNPKYNKQPNWTHEELDKFAELYELYLA